jgi:CRISPR/Cas system-associated exonuclease Cas4 (RecB family)
MKALTNRHMLAGNILHSLIDLRLRRGAGWAAPWFTQKAAERFDTAVAFSKHPEQVVGDSRFTPQILSEIAYEESDADSLVLQSRTRLLTAMQTFLSNPLIQAVYQPVTAGEHDIEAKVKELRLADFSIDGKVDLLGRDDDGIQIVDWKIGEADSFDDSLQLFIYGLWLGRKYAEPPNRIRARKVFLTGPTVSQPVALNDAMMRRGKARIVQDIELMQELDPYGRQGNEEAFTPCAHPNVCRQCSFRGVCSAGSSTTKSKLTSVSLPLLQMAS